MANIDLADAQAWIEPTKLTLTVVDSQLEAQISSHIFSRLLGTFTTTAWNTPATTPAIVRSIIAMYFVAWTYDKFYSDDAEANAYAELLRRYADVNIAGLIAGTVELVELPDANINVSSPSFFPTDLSSSQAATSDNPSDGPPAFTMGTVF